MFHRNEITEASLIHPPVTGAATQRFPWTELEEYRPDGGMWSIPATREVQAHIAATAEIMRDVPEFKRAMRRALTEWPKSCAVAMTTPGLNKRAWLGHAGCYLATGSPEETTRLGWHDLNDDQQRTANAAADAVIGEWRKLNAHAKQAADDQIGLFDA